MFNSQTIKDFAKLAQGTFATLGSLNNEIDVIVKSKIEKILASKGLVFRDEFDVAISRIDDLKMELAIIRSRLDGKNKTKK